MYELSHKLPIVLSRGIFRNKKFSGKFLKCLQFKQSSQLVPQNENFVSGAKKSQKSPLKQFTEKIIFLNFDNISAIIFSMTKDLIDTL